MKTKVVDAALAEAERFLERARTLKALPVEYGGYGPSACPERAAVRRASLDLTRSLAALRRREA